jgi:hypothetical protein
VRAEVEAFQALNPQLRENETILQDNFEKEVENAKLINYIDL